MVKKIVLARKYLISIYHASTICSNLKNNHSCSNLHNVRHVLRKKCQKAFQSYRMRLHRNGEIFSIGIICLLIYFWLDKYSTAKMIQYKTFDFVRCSPNWHFMDMNLQSPCQAHVFTYELQAQNIIFITTWKREKRKEEKTFHQNLLTIYDRLSICTVRNTIWISTTAFEKVMLYRSPQQHLNVAHCHCFIAKCCFVVYLILRPI